MGKSAWIAAGIAIGLAAAIGGYLLLKGRSAQAGPYGGDVVPIDNGAGYAELLANQDSGEVMVHTWDKDLATRRPLAAKQLTIESESGRVALEPHPMAGDPPGSCSRFYGQADWMRGGGHHRGWLVMGEGGPRHEFAWTRCWDAGRAHGGMWEEMGAHRRMGPGGPYGEGRRVPMAGER
jgi:hypothetical protein